MLFGRRHGNFDTSDVTPSRLRYTIQRQARLLALELVDQYKIGLSDVTLHAMPEAKKILEMRISASYNYLTDYEVSLSPIHPTLLDLSGTAVSGSWLTWILLYAVFAIKIH